MTRIRASLLVAVAVVGIAVTGYAATQSTDTKSTPEAIQWCTTHIVQDPLGLHWVKKCITT